MERLGTARDRAMDERERAVAQVFHPYSVNPTL